MKIKHFTAPTTTMAMSDIRAELGYDAIIISTETTSEGVIVTAALEAEQNINFNNNDCLEVVPSLQVYDDMKIRESLEYHDILPDIAGQILANARKCNADTHIFDAHQLLTSVLQNMYGFSNLLSNGNKNKIFLGTPGCGKSTIIAKVATQAKLQNIKTSIISTDNVRAGANSQLSAFASILQTDFYFCKSARELFDVTQQQQMQYDLLLIDTPGINPYLDNEVQRVSDLIDSVKADKILAQDAGRNTLETIETADIFARLGAQYIVPTHLDMTRRIGSVLSSAFCSQLQFCAASVSANIAKGLANITAQSLAGLILAD